MPLVMLWVFPLQHPGRKRKGMRDGPITLLKDQEVAVPIRPYSAEGRYHTVLCGTTDQQHVIPGTQRAQNLVCAGPAAIMARWFTTKAISNPEQTFQPNSDSGIQGADFAQG